MGEFGIDWRKSDADNDPQGKAVNWHNGLWAGRVVGRRGRGDVVVVGQLHRAEKPLWADHPACADLHGHRPLDHRPLGHRSLFDAPTILGGWPGDTHHDLVLPGASGWGKSAATDFALNAGGHVAGTPPCPSFLYSPGKPDLRTAPTPPRPLPKSGPLPRSMWTTVSNVADLHILLDGTGKIVGDFPLSAAPPADPNVKPEYKATHAPPGVRRHLPGRTGTRSTALTCPPGTHTITLDVASGDWLHLDQLHADGLPEQPLSRPDCRLDGPASWDAGRSSGRRTRATTGRTSSTARPSRPSPERPWRCAGCPPGTTGSLGGTRRAASLIRACDGGGQDARSLPLRLPPLATDVAAQITPVKR